MISDINDKLLSRLAVRLVDHETKNVIGTGLLYYHQNLVDKVYVLTAAHNLFKDRDSFIEPRKKIQIDLFNSGRNSYQSIIHEINYSLVLSDKNKDVAVLPIGKQKVVKLIGDDISTIYAIKERFDINSFVAKGFPQATQGKELACIYPSWGQAMTEVNKFQLKLREDYTGWNTQGFSGSGVFLYANKQLYLYGIFTRFRPEEKGRVIYCQYIETVNEILQKNYLPLIKYTFLGDYNLTPNFFKTQVTVAINDLGPRFREDLNFRLPIALAFNDLSKDEVFKRRLIKATDKWLAKQVYGSYNGSDKLIEPILEEYSQLKEDTRKWIFSINWQVEESIDLSELTLKFKLFDQNIELRKKELWNLRWEEQRKQYEESKKYDYHEPYTHELSKLNQISRSNDDFFDDIKKIKITLSNKPYLLIQGEAGSGKSHLLGDIANERIKQNKPTLLLLGQYFKSSKTIWGNILEQLQLHCTKEELLKSLNNIGKQINSRVLILIDALNEGSGKEIWPNELAGFIHEIKQYPFIGLSLTIRSTYYRSIVPESLQNNDEITHLTHEGFKGNEYAALRLFCRYFELELPSFPILSPEFTNPLFLQLICNGVKNSGQKTFPQGFQDISKLYDFYLSSIYKKLAKKREEYKSREHIIVNALNEFALKCFENENRTVLERKETVDFFDNKYQKYKHLYNDFISEGILIQKINRNYDSNSEIEVVYFAYERFGDFVIAQTILDHYKTKEEVLEAFKKNNHLGILLADSWWRYTGIFEALSILLPERFELEIIEAYDWAFDGEHEGMVSNIDEWLSGYLLDSLKWRNVQSINDEKLRELFQNEKIKIDDDGYFYKLIELTSIHDHPFNSDRLFKILSSVTMAERDAFWQKFLRYFSYYNDDGIAYPIRRLIDWAWQPNIPSKVDTESARLVSQTLAWVLSSTDRQLRDQVTKAMVNLLEEQTDALLKILQTFNDIDDLYISERLYGVAYGCVLRTSKNKSILKIAQYVFDTIFKDGISTNHILLRDYARNIVEYALYKRLPISGDITLIKPPYKSEFPQKILSKEEIDTLEYDHNDEDFKIKNKGLHNRIIFDVMEWDFGKKTIDSALRDFCPFSFTMEENYKSFLRRIDKTHRDSIKLYESILKLQAAYNDKKSYYEKRADMPEFLNLVSNLDDDLTKIIERVKIDFNESEYDYLINSIIPHFENKARLSDWHRSFFDTTPIRRWVVQRVFELGYDNQIHGDYDSAIDRFSSYHGSKMERIGEKYQWIAFHEIMGIVTDNFKIRKDNSGTGKKYDFFQGAWQLFLRDVDPIFTTKNKEDNNESEDESYNSLGWWFDAIYNYWDQPNSVWVNQNQDLPDPKHIISRKDNSDKEWIYLEAHIKWKEPKRIGEDRYNMGGKQIWYSIYSYIVKKGDKKKINNWLKQQNFWGAWLPQSNDYLNLSLFNREHYWSPASKSHTPEHWSKINDKNYKVKVSTTCAVGEMSEDKSGAHFYYNMPCKTIFEGMNLQYASRDGEFKNSNDEIVVINPDYDLIMIRKNDFKNFLDENDLDIIWVLLGEKIATDDSFHRSENNYFKVINGVYSLEDGYITGSLKLDDRN